VLNQVYANVLGKPVLVPQTEVTSLGSAIFAFLAAGTFQTVEQAQSALCPQYRIVEPDPAAVATYQQLYPVFRDLYFEFGKTQALPTLRRVAASVRKA
jgi:L-ribulokinase